MSGVECYCGGEIRAVPLPGDLQKIAGQKSIWVHVTTGDTLCYPDTQERGQEQLKAEPIPPGRRPGVA